MSASCCPREARSASRPLIIAILFCFATICVATNFGTGRAAAATTVNSNITSNTTWTTAGSPYIITAQVSVAAGATLTIQPGVTVEFDGAKYLGLYINGTIKSIGTAANPITFTSAQGAAGQGAPGQYEGVNVQTGTSSQFSYTNFYYGAWGSGGYYAYGALTVENTGTQVSIDHSVFEYNEYSGLHLGNGVVTVTSSTFEDNGDGISQQVNQSPGQLILSDSIVSYNVQNGLWFNAPDNLSTPGSSINNNLITANGSHGIEMEMDCSTPMTSFPHGNQNDIYGNGDENDPSDGSDLYIFPYACHAISVDWTGNYWGDDVGFDTGPTPLVSELSCEGAGPPSEWYESDPLTQPQGYLAYADSADPTEPPPGPISTGNYLTFSSIVCPDGQPGELTFYNVYNTFYLGPKQISTQFIPIP